MWWLVQLHAFILANHLNPSFPTFSLVFKNHFFDCIIYIKLAVYSDNEYTYLTHHLDMFLNYYYYYEGCDYQANVCWQMSNTIKRRL